MAYPEGRKQLLPSDGFDLGDESNPVTIDGQKMIISTAISSVTGWKYTSVLPFNVVMQKVLVIKDFYYYDPPYKYHCRLCRCCFYGLQVQQATGKHFA